ncbi:MAG: hypothetical protein ACXIVG_05345 [Pararhodobacter sp.]
MKLAVRTSSGAYGAALIGADGTLSAEIEGEGSRRSPGELVADLLRMAGFDPGAVDTVLVDLGPGGLSSTRVGVSFASAFAFGTGARLFGVSALDMQVHQARRQTDLPLLSLRPAPGGQVFWLLDQGDPQARRGGCGALADVLAGMGAELPGRFALTGPLARLKGIDAAPGGAQPIPVDPPDMASLALTRPRAAVLHAGIALLEPITDTRALLDDAAKP